MRTLFVLLSCVSFGLIGCGEDTPFFAGSSTDPVLIDTTCDASSSDSSFGIGELAIQGDLLRIAVTYSGGCEDHEFSACWDGTFLESNPVQAQLAVHHEDNGDSCEAAITRDVFVDLSLLRSRFQNQTGTIEIVIAGAAAGISYQF